MHRIQFIHPPADNPAVRRRAIIASFLFHGLVLTGLLLFTLYYASLPPPPNGSAAGAPTMTLQPMVVAATPSEPPPPSPPQPPLPTPPLPVATVTAPVTPVPMPEVGLPVLPPVPAKTSVAKQESPHHEPKSHSTSQSAAKSAAKSAAAAVASSYSPGASYFKHPPYPEEARSRNESGTVLMLVEFDTQGDVSRAEIAESSGVPVLDATTRSFIRENWHSSEYAGQSINVPVEYQLENR